MIGVSDLALSVALANFGILLYVFYHIFTKKPQEENKEARQAKRESESESSSKLILCRTVQIDQKPFVIR